MKRDATKTIWRTVVFAGAMLAVPACGGKKAQNTTPSNTQSTTTEQTAPAPTDNATPPPAGSTESTAADPCEGGERPRGGGDEGGGTGRGFVLS